MTLRSFWASVSGACLLIALFTCGLFLPATAYAEEMATVQLEVTYGQTEARTMLDMINDFRTGNDAWAWDETSTNKIRYSNLEPLVYDYDLERIAMQRAAETAVMFSHTRPNGEWCFSCTYNGRSFNGENIAPGRTAAESFEMWQETNELYEDQGHRRNMLNSQFKAVGIGHAVVDGEHYWVQIFSVTAPQSTNPTSPANNNQSVPVDIAVSNIDGITFNCSDSSRIALIPGGSKELPTVSASISIKDSLPISVPFTVNDWSISDTSVARIENGEIKAVSDGTTVLSGTAQILNYQQAFNIDVFVTSNNIEAANIVLTETTGLVFDGHEQRPTVESVTLGNTALVAGADYTVTYSDNVYPTNKASVVVAGTGTYIGEREFTFSISGIRFPTLTNDSRFTMNRVGAQYLYYDGTAHEPKLNVAFDGTPLREGIDYELRYQGDNTNAGYPSSYFTAWVYGLNAFAGGGKTSDEGLFVIQKAPLNNSRVVEVTVPDCDYTGEAQEPAVSVKVNGNELPSEDYTIQYSNNTNVGTASVTLTANSSNVSGSRTVQFAIKPINLESSENVSVAPIPNLEFTGSAIEPIPAVSYSGKSLTPGTDFTVSYANNTNVGTATATITGKGNYAGTINKTFEVLPVVISENDVTVEDESLSYTSEPIEPELQIAARGNTLVPESDFDVVYSNNVNAGEGTVTITAKGNYSGRVTKSFTIAPLNLANKNKLSYAVVAIDPMVYDGTAKTIGITAMVKSGPALPESDYSIEYENNVNAGTAIARIIPASNNLINQSEDITFTISPAKLTLDGGLIVSNPNESVTYNGEPRTPDGFAITGLEQGRDYTLSYSNNVDAGNATVTFTGIGNYTGSVDYHFTIYPASISNCDVQVESTQYVYTGQPCEPAATVLFKGKQLEVGKDYKVAYENNTEAGTAQATVTGKGNFSGSYGCYYEIAPKDIAGASVTLNPDTFVYNGQKREPAVAVELDGFGVLALNTDYTVTYDEATAIGDHTVTVNGTGNFTGNASGSYRIDETKTVSVNGIAFTYRLSGSNASIAAIDAGDATSVEIPTEIDGYTVVELGTGALQSIGAGVEVTAAEGSTASVTDAVDEFNGARADAAASSISRLLDNLDLESLDALNNETRKAVKDASDIYDTLSDAQKALAGNALATIENAENQITNLEKAKEVADTINALPTTISDDDDAAAVQAARDAYDALSDKQKAIVDAAGYGTVLEGAESAAAQYATDKANKAEADKVESLIENLPEAVYDDDDAQAVRDAREAYEALTDPQKSFVSNDALSQLGAAETAAETYADNKSGAQAVIDLIASLPGNVSSDEDAAAVQAARDAYENLTDYQKAIVNAHGCLTALEDAESAAGNYTRDKEAAANAVKVGTIAKAGSGASLAQYKITSATEAQYYKCALGNKAKSVSIPATVVISGKTFSVTSIGNNALAKRAKLVKVTVGANVTKIGAKAFMNCKKLKSATFKTKKLKSIGKKAFKGTAAKIKVKVPKAKKKAYKTMLKKAGLPKKGKVK